MIGFWQLGHSISTPPASLMISFASCSGSLSFFINLSSPLISKFLPNFFHPLINYFSRPLTDKEIIPKTIYKGGLTMQPTLKELIHSVETKEVAAEWDRPEELMIRFNGLKKSTLYDYLKEMDSIPEFKQGIMRPGVTFIHIGTFIWYLRWKDASRYRSKKPKPEEVMV